VEKGLRGERGVRHLDPKGPIGCVIGLSPKGRKAKRDTSGFVVRWDKFGYLNAIHYMAPHTLGGVGNLCPHASEGCKALCLGHYSGQAGMVCAELLASTRRVAA